MGAKKKKKKQKQKEEAEAAVLESVADPAEEFCHEEGTLSILGVEGVHDELRVAPREATVVAKTMTIIRTMLRERYTLFLADREGAHVRVEAFDERRGAYVVPGPDGESFSVPITRGRAIALPQPVGG